uniref:Uncharacterized protein n=1 Tax=Branchiostoma floridae TaxID=7739 RepID=C3Y0A7_BRAFL|eukprot:XP_002610170.1 hypothetical protein BRAFLDRAFT_77072 [Branchiostoma floridae]
MDSMICMFIQKDHPAQKYRRGPEKTHTFQQVVCLILGVFVHLWRLALWFVIRAISSRMAILIPRRRAADKTVGRPMGTDRRSPVDPDLCTMCNVWPGVEWGTRRHTPGSLWEGLGSRRGLEQTTRPTHPVRTAGKDAGITTFCLGIYREINADEYCRLYRLHPAQFSPQHQYDSSNNDLFYPQLLIAPAPHGDLHLKYLI